MSSTQKRLQQLLDGELDPSEIADDPALVSLADRLYGIKIAPVQPVKRRNLSAAGEDDDITEVAPPTNMMVEVIEPIAPALDAPALAAQAVQPLGSLPPVPEVAKKSSPLRTVFGLGLVVSVLNLFGAFGGVLGGMCDPSDLCPADGYNRINWASIHQLSTGQGWSLSILEGSYGIPDLIAIIGCCIGLVLFTRGK